MQMSFGKGLGRIGTLRGSIQVKVFCIDFHHSGLGAKFIEAEIFGKPDQATRIKRCHMLPLDQRHMITKPLQIKIQQLPTMRRYLLLRK